jgi:hypothetical protein
MGQDGKERERERERGDKFQKFYISPRRDWISRDDTRLKKSRIFMTTKLYNYVLTLKNVGLIPLIPNIQIPEVNDWAQILNNY